MMVDEYEVLLNGRGTGENALLVSEVILQLDSVEPDVLIRKYEVRLHKIVTKYLHMNVP